MKLYDLNDFFHDCYQLMNEYSQALEYEDNAQWPDQRIIAYTYGPIYGLYRENSTVLREYLVQECDLEELKSLILSVFVNENKPKNNPLLDNYDTIRLWLYKMNPDLEDRLNDTDKDYVLTFFFLSTGYDNYVKTQETKDFMEQPTIKELYGSIVTNNYDLIPINSEIELLIVEPVRIYDSYRNKTIFIEINQAIASILHELWNKKMIGKLSVKGNNANIKNKLYIKETIHEEFERGIPFSFNLSKLPSITKLYSSSYRDQLWIKVSKKEITFEELCDDFHIQDNFIRTQMIHLEYTQLNGEYLITHLDHEYIYYTEENYLKRIDDNLMATKGEGHKRIKTFKIDESIIPFDYPCRVNHKMNQKNPTDVPFLFFILDNYFSHKDLLEEYFCEAIHITK